MARTGCTPQSFFSLYMVMKAEVEEDLYLVLRLEGDDFCILFSGFESFIGDLPSWNSSQGSCISQRDRPRKFHCAKGRSCHPFHMNIFWCMMV